MYCFHSLFYFTHTKLKWPWARDAREVRHMVWEHGPLRTPTLPGGSWAKTGWPVGSLWETSACWDGGGGGGAQLTGLLPGKVLPSPGPGWNGDQSCQELPSALNKPENTAPGRANHEAEKVLCCRPRATMWPRKEP